MRDPRLQRAADRHGNGRGLNAISNQSPVAKGQVCRPIVWYLAIVLLLMTGPTDNGKSPITKPGTKTQEFISMPNGQPQKKRALNRQLIGTRNC